MPSALETLVKILKLEREQGCKNKAVIGGLSAYSEKWLQDAHKQARLPQHHILVDELADLMRAYDDIANLTERAKTISYMLDRITNRQPAPPEYQERLHLYEQSDVSTPPQKSERAEDKALPENRASDSYQSDAPPVAKKKEAQRTRKSTKSSSSGRTFTPQQDLPPEPRLARPPRKPRPALDPDEAAARLQALEQPVSVVKGIGPRIAEQFAKLGIHSINDALLYLPRRYDDYTRLNYISKLQPNTVQTVIGKVTHTEVRIGRGGRKDFFMLVDDDTGILQVIFFGQHYLIRTIKKGLHVVLSGKISIYGHRLQMTNPEWEYLDTENLHTVGIVPVYPLTEGVKARSFRRNMKRIVDTWADKMPDYVPEATLERVDLADISWTIRNLHFPEGHDHLEHARRRFVFDQLLLLQLGVLANRHEWQSVPGIPLDISDDFLEMFVQSAFPYELTNAQWRAIREIRQDMAAERPMNRLLQGDVGAGKTAVAIVALALTFAAGKQGAMMAPTSILAEQHYRNVQKAFEQVPLEHKPVIALLTGALTKGERESIYRGLADGSIDIVIGTHALIQDGVEFNELALAIIDEQHKFGVEQRRALRGKGVNPHLLVMTATPIPRTLALTFYADLDLSILDEKPPGRQKVQTHYVYSVARERVYEFVQKQVNEGRQAFIVNPLVEASETINAMSAEEAYQRAKDVFFRHKVCLLHGRMSPEEKDEVMTAFAKGEYDIMVTTTVAEVGVDVPNATVMVIENANRFGLAQLHQLRGRVGRGEYESYCILITDDKSPEAITRLEAMQATDDGFKLAEIDWKQRGAGEIVGTRQSGGGGLLLGEYVTPELAQLAQQEARTIFEEDPTLSLPEHRLLAERVRQIYHPQTDIS